MMLPVAMGWAPDATVVVRMDHARKPRWPRR